MEMEGHPTHDIVEELEQRGAIRLVGSSFGPESSSLEVLIREAPGMEGSWLFLPDSVYSTGFDEPPS